MTGTVHTTCPYCGVGCGVKARPDAAVAGDTRHPANFGRLCVKGSTLAETTGQDTRLLHPVMDGQRTNWDAALDRIADVFRRTIEEHGPDSVAFYVSGQLLTEDYYVANKLMKGFIGSGNIDTNSRLCMASAVAGHRRAFGEDVVPGCYEDWELADLAILVGSNTAWCHPVLYQRLLAARAERGTRIVVIDPRRTATCAEADLHLPIKPGTDVLLFNALLAEIHRRGFVDRRYVAAHTTGFDDAINAALADVPDLASVARRCDVPLADLVRFIDWFLGTPRTVTAFSMGVNQSSQGTDKVNAIINCHLATGRVGKPGSTPFSITGQPNAMGGREVGGLANQLAAHMNFENPDDLDRVRRFWNAPRLADRPGMKAVDLFDAVGDGRIKALWIMATNPAVSMPHAGAVREALARCPFVVVSDCVADTDTARFAHVLLPATGWGEKDGTVTNSERRISRQRAFLPASGEARPDWWIITEVARRMGFAEAFDYAKPADIFREHVALSAFENSGARAFNLAGWQGLSDAAYDALTPTQWPVLPGAPQGQPRLFSDGRFSTPDGRARLIAVRHSAPVNAPATDRPLVLNTGRIRDQWHTMTRTGLVPRLSRHISEPLVDMTPEDAAVRGLTEGSMARLSSRWGEALARVRLTDGQRPGEVFLAMHWNDSVTSAGAADRLVNPVVDPVSGQPELKHTPVEVAPWPASWNGFLLSPRRFDPDCAYWTRNPTEGGYVYELADTTSALSAAEAMRRFLQPAADAEVLEYADPSRGIVRLASVTDGRLQEVLFLAPVGRLPDRGWLLSLFEAGTVEAAARAGLLAGRAPGAAVDNGPIVCACFRVGLNQIVEAIASGQAASVSEIGAALKAGTNCGSCVPELKTILAREATRDAA